MIMSMMLLTPGRLNLLVSHEKRILNVIFLKLMDTPP